MRVPRLLLLLVAAAPAFAQSTVTIRVNAADTIGPFQPIYGYFGYDEPNNTYTNNGRKLIGELANLSSGPVYIRTHFMLATGDCSPSRRVVSKISTRLSCSRTFLFPTAELLMPFVLLL